MIQLIQTLLLVILVDRSLFIRNRYKIAIEFGSYDSRMEKTRTTHFAIWLLCKKGQAEVYTRDGGKRLFFVETVRKID